jgi:trk system potassium uptake protein TrkH
LRDIWLEETMVRGVLFILACYGMTYFLGGLLGTLYGYPPHVALFDSVSAGSNTGLSAGLVGPSMPWALKVYYILAMWAGRLEFVSVFALLGMTAAFFKGKNSGEGKIKGKGRRK